MTEAVVTKRVGVNETYELDWRREIVKARRPEYDYSLDSIMRPIFGNGFYYRATTAGQTDRITPDLKPTEGETTQDGSVVWTAEHPNNAATGSITASVWTPDAGIAEASKAILGFSTFITISGGLAGEQYRLVNLITKSNGEQEERSIIVELEDFQPV